jgi:hypothetical protein
MLTEQQTGVEPNAIFTGRERSNGDLLSPETLFTYNSRHFYPSVVSGLHGEVDEICPETSVRNYHYMLRNISVEGRSKFYPVLKIF